MSHAQTQAQEKMTKAQRQRYCDLVHEHREKTGTNPDGKALARIGREARRLKT